MKKKATDPDLDNYRRSSSKDFEDEAEIHRLTRTNATWPTKGWRSLECLGTLDPCKSTD